MPTEHSALCCVSYLVTVRAVIGLWLNIMAQAVVLMVQEMLGSKCGWLAGFWLSRVSSSFSLLRTGKFFAGVSNWATAASFHFIIH